MKLSYRGVSYESEPSILEIQAGEMGGKYRGQAWQYRYPRHIPQLHPKLYKQYRGVAYSTYPALLTEKWATSYSTNPNQYSPVSLNSPCKVVVNEIATAHLENMRSSLERRLQIAKSRHDQQLVNLLEQEYQQLVLSL